jgi:hypothetical protein
MPPFRGRPLSIQNVADNNGQKTAKQFCSVGKILTFIKANVQLFHKYMLIIFVKN